jgi:FKBP-type peptidyl-prolyl cis-trans isomerase
MKKANWLPFLLSLIVLASCTGTGMKKTKSGLEYKIFENGTGAKAKKGEFLKFNYKITVRDSVLTSSYDAIPGYDVVDSVGRPYDISEVMKFLRVGDSVVAYQSFDSIVKMSMSPPPAFLHKGDKIKTTLKVLAILPSDRQLAIEDYNKELDKFKMKEVAEIQKYLSSKNIQATQTRSGAFVEVTNKGTGAACDSGKQVAIKYNGYTFDGKYFDSNIDSSRQTQRHPMDPFKFISGREGAVAGLLEGIQSFNNGGKGRVFVPSMLGYGPRSLGKDVPPYSNLIFDVEVVDVSDAPAPQIQPNIFQQAPRRDSTSTAKPKKAK